jgi:hydroxymethylpyrimidine/phosphomethylpyrimidine kinase
MSQIENISQTEVPVVLVLGGIDPSGGAGIQADIETLSSMGCHAAPVVTAITVQNTVDVIKFEPIDANLIMAQARAVLEDISIAAIKIGMLGSPEAVEVVQQLLLDYPDKPVILDPILHAGGGANLADEDVIDLMVDFLFPLVSVLTPNSEEARLLAPQADNLDACAQELLDIGCEYVLITGAHENTPTVINKLFTEQQLLESCQWDGLPGSFEGSGCTV